jgi:hypothetical protein
VLAFAREIAVFNVRLPIIRASSAARLALLSAVLATGLPICAGFAQTVAPQTSVAQAVAALKANPEQFLTQYPNGGPEMVSRAREFALNDPTALDSIIALLAKATKDQKIAIATGLAQAARIVVRTNQPYANRIQQAIADTKDQDAVLAYAAAIGDVAIAATGSAGAGSAGASGGQTNAIGGTGTGGGSLEGINGGNTNTGLFSFTSSTSGIGTTSTTVSP